MDDSSKNHQMLLLLLLAATFGGNVGDQTKETMLLSMSHSERLASLENRLTQRDDELARMLQLMLSNQNEILQLLRPPLCNSSSSFPTDGTQQPPGTLPNARCSPSNRASEKRSSPNGILSSAKLVHAESHNTDLYPRSCREIPDGMSGEETIYPSAGPAGPGEPLEVYCDQDFEDGGWIVIQNRFDGFVNFNRSWEKYRDGFGDIGTEYWIGLDEIHRLTGSVPHEIAFVAESFQGERRWARYSLFEIRGETDRYRLEKLGVYSGTLGDEFTYNMGMEFSTFDQDHDKFENVNCALRTASGWWHRSCTRINLNGMYGNESGVRFAYWLDWLHLQGLKRTRIMIREIKKRRK
ncbi:fibrinogen-like protein A [Anopheles maculipalpis]|uniref:fibrinogen-like protein A n=1 Tax=Anopheles maculipalpis TaxID=1496333 RepID=UPI002158A2E0|nr:fibrinogen-like protein A [Anopheles maculipalpis]